MLVRGVGPQSGAGRAKREIVIIDVFVEHNLSQPKVVFAGHEDDVDGGDECASQRRELDNCSQVFVRYL